MDKAGEFNRWLISIIIGLIGLMLGSSINLYTFVNQQATTNRHMEITLAHELSKEFYKNKLYKNIRMTIEDNKPLYLTWGGKYNNDEINQYLGFFENLGFYYKYEVLSIDTINHYFGGYIIEAYENKELKKYIKGIRDNYKENDALVEFEKIALILERRPERMDLVNFMRRFSSQKRR